MDWDEVRKNRLSKDRPDDWPEGVWGISLKGVGLLGIHEKTGKVYWDGKEIVTKRSISLGTYERWAAGLAATGTFGTFVVNVGRAKGWWS